MGDTEYCKKCNSWSECLFRGYCPDCLDQLLDSLKDLLGL